ncbi:hypothetical protein IAT38_000559 [Cryptococcus sp. DSM 104549]
MFSPKSSKTVLLTSPADPNRIPPMESAGNVSWALSDKTRAQDPKYIKAVIESYVRLKLAKGKSVKEVGQKLDPLEREFPKLSQYFIDARETYNLGISRAITLRRASEASSLERPLSHLTDTSVAHITPYRSPTSTSSRTSTSDVVVELTVTSSRPIPGREREEPATVRQAAAAPRQLGWHEPAGNGRREDVPEYSDETTPPPYSSEDPLPASEWMASTWSVAERDSAAADTGSRLTRLPPSSTTSSSSTSRPQRSPRPLPPTPTGPSPTSPRLQPRSFRLSEDAETAEAWEEHQLEQALRESLALEAEQDDVARAVYLSLEESRAREGWSTVATEREGLRGAEGRKGQQQGVGVAVEAAASGLGGVRSKNPFLRREAGRLGGSSCQSQPS